MERLGLPSRVWFGQSYDQVHKLYEYILKVEEAKKKSCESVIHMTADVKKIHIYRSRRCNSPIPLDGGTDCYGDKLEARAETCSAAAQCTCRDVHNQQSCEHWKSLGYCSNGIYVGFMTENCMTTCGMCPSNKKMPYNLSNLNKLTRLIIRSRWRLVQNK